MAQAQIEFMEKNEKRNISLKRNLIRKVDIIVGHKSVCVYRNKMKIKLGPKHISITKDEWKYLENNRTNINTAFKLTSI